MSIDETDKLFTNFQFGQTDEIEIELASPWRRMGAVLLNSVYSFLCWIPFLFGMFIILLNDKRMYDDQFLPTMKVVSLIGTVIFQIYQLVILSKYGYTLGKKHLGLRVVKTDGSAAGFVGAFLLREVVYLVSIALIQLVFIILFSGIENSERIAADWIQFFVTIVCVCMMFGHKERRTLQDLIAGTMVIKMPK